MVKKWIVVFMIFFLGTSALITVDHICRESTGYGGQTGLSVSRAADGDLSISFFGLRGELNL